MSTNLGRCQAGSGGQLAGSGAGRLSRVSVSLPPRPPPLTGREASLAELHRLLTEGSGPQTVVLTGPGGAGKTSIAVEFAHRHLAEVGVAWQLAAEDETVLGQGLAGLAGELGGRDIAGQRDPVESIHAMLAEWPARWLLIFDHARDRESVHRFLPPAGQGWVIVTSESQQWPGQVVRDVPVLGTAVAARFLVSRTGDTDEAAAAELADQLDGLPLALEQAAACAQTAGIRLASYLRMFRQRRADVLARGGPAEQAAVAATLGMAMSSLENQSPHAAGLLRLLACLAPEPVPVSLFWRRPDLAAALPGEVAASVGPLMGDQFAFADAVAALRRYSLISSPGPGLVLVHRLIQGLALDEASAESAAAYRQAGAVIAEAAVPADTESPRTWPHCAAVLPHARATLPRGADALGRLASYLGSSGNHAAARDLWQAIAQARHDEPGSGGHPQALAASREAARWTGRAGNPAAARDQLAELLPVSNRVLAFDHPDVLALRHDLGYWTGEAGDRAAARDQFAELLPVYERVLGSDHPDVLAARHNLANWTGQAGDPAAARDQYAELLPVYTRVLGTDHRDTLTARHNLAYWTGEAGNPTAARDQFAELLPIYTRVLGTDHRDTLTARHNLANWTGEAGNPTAARDQFAELLPIKERVLGPGHRSTQATRNSLDSLVITPGG